MLFHWHPDGASTADAPHLHLGNAELRPDAVIRPEGSHPDRPGCARGGDRPPPAGVPGCAASRRRGQGPRGVPPALPPLANLALTEGHGRRHPQVPSTRDALPGVARGGTSAPCCAAGAGRVSGTPPDRGTSGLEQLMQEAAALLVNGRSNRPVAAGTEPPPGRRSARSGRPGQRPAVRGGGHRRREPAQRAACGTSRRRARSRRPGRTPRPERPRRAGRCAVAGSWRSPAGRSGTAPRGCRIGSSCRCRAGTPEVFARCGAARRTAASVE